MCLLDAVLVVGWGYDSGSGSYYWLLKNSWSTTWGESGYVRVKMTGDGAGPCGMLQVRLLLQLNFILLCLT